MHILIVDDARTYRYVLIKMLKNLGYNNVSAAASVPEAKKMLSEQPIDVLLCDWHMPGETGLDLLKFVRTTPKLAKIPFVMITTENDKTRILEAVKIGIQAFLFKPIQTNTLDVKLKDIIAVIELKSTK
jgi:CheY-like chemotaxis protein